MTIERMNELMRFIEASQVVMREASSLPEYRATVDNDAEDVINIIHGAIAAEKINKVGVDVQKMIDDLIAKRGNE